MDDAACPLHSAVVFGLAVYPWWWTVYGKLDTTVTVLLLVWTAFAFFHIDLSKLCEKGRAWMVISNCPSLVGGMITRTLPSLWTRVPALSWRLKFSRYGDTIV